MKIRLLVLGLIVCGLQASLSSSVFAQQKSKFPDWDSVTKETEKLSGLFNLYFSEKNQKLYMEISRSQFGRELILPISIARGAGRTVLGGDTLNFGDQWVITFKRAADRILVVRRNIKYRAKPGTELADALEVSYTDSVIDALPVRSEKAGGSSVLIDLADLFMQDLAGIGIFPDRTRSTWSKVKAFDDNLSIMLSAVFSSRSSGDDSVPDPRGTQVVIHYGLSKLPSTGYSPRVADDRVGYFLSTINDFSTDVHETPKVRYVNRWNVQKSDPSAKSSPAKKPIVFYIEKTVPRKYRPYVRAGILEWNKAFEKIGIIDAIQVRDQLSSDDFDAEDIRYNTFRWITTSDGFAMGPSRTNPKTGEILDADIIFDEGMIRYYREDYLRNIGLPEGMEMLAEGNMRGFLRLHASDVPQWSQLQPHVLQEVKRRQQLIQAEREQSPLHAWNKQHQSSCQHCLMGMGVQRQLGLMAATMGVRNAVPGGQVPEEYIGQAIKEVVMHELGHTLGLRHNFKASTMLSLEEINDPEVTAKRGMVGSVMDYAPANFALKDQEQGDYFTQTIGPYDYWAIEYAYKPISGNPQEELAKIASRAPEKELIYATDEDLSGNPDPRINLWDLGDPLEFAEHRITFVKQMLEDLEEKVVAEGDGYQRLRYSFNTLINELATSTSLASLYIGGEYTARDHKGDENARPPMTPIDLKKQLQAFQLLQKEIFSDDLFDFSPDLLRKLAPEHVSDGFHSTSNYAYPIYGNVLSIQRIALSNIMAGSTLRAIQEIELHADEDQEVLTLPVLFDNMTIAVFPQLLAEDNENKELKLSTIRRNLQREYLNRLSQMITGGGGNSLSSLIMLSSSRGSVPADARSLARQTLKKLNKQLTKVLNPKAKLKMDGYTRAHLNELKDSIEATLKAEVILSN